jgi:hypothetical protein
MASKRKFKRELNYMVFDVIEECFSVQLYDEKKTEVTNQLIDEVIEFRNKMAAKVHASKSKKDFTALNTEVEDAAVDFIHKINGLH